MQTSGVGLPLIRVPLSGQDLALELLTPGRVMEAEVVSVFQDRAVLGFGSGVQMEVQLQVPLQEGQKVRVQVQPRQSPDVQLQMLPRDGEPVVMKLLGVLKEARAATAADVQAPKNAPQAKVGGEQVAWLPIPLPDGKQGWAQLYIRDDASPKARGRKAGPGGPQVRLWWETPGLGPVQVTLDGSAGLAALFTVQLAAVRSLVEQGLPDLQQRLVKAGFPEARLGCRQAAQGERIEPARPDGGSLLDRRL